LVKKLYSTPGIIKMFDIIKTFVGTGLIIFI